MTSHFPSLNTQGYDPVLWRNFCMLPLQTRLRLRNSFVAAFKLGLLTPSSSSSSSSSSKRSPSLSAYGKFEIQVVIPNRKERWFMINSKSRRWAAKLLKYLARMLGVRASHIVVVANGQRLDQFDIDRVWKTRKTAVYMLQYLDSDDELNTELNGNRGVYAKPIPLSSSSASLSPLLGKYNSTSLDAQGLPEINRSYLKQIMTNLENMISNGMFAAESDLNSLKQFLDHQLTTQYLHQLMISQGNSLSSSSSPSSTVVAVRRVESRGLIDILYDCGVVAPLHFAQYLSRLVGSAVRNTIDSFKKAGGVIKHEALMAYFTARMREHQIENWLFENRQRWLCYAPSVNPQTGVYYAQKCVPISSPISSFSSSLFLKNGEGNDESIAHVGCGLCQYNSRKHSSSSSSSSSSSDEEEEKDKEGYSSSSSSSSSDDDDNEAYKSSKYSSSSSHGHGRRYRRSYNYADTVHDSSEYVGRSLNSARNSISGQYVNFNLLRNVNVVKFMDRKAYQKFSWTGTTLVEPGDGLETIIKKASRSLASTVSKKGKSFARKVLKYLPRRSSSSKNSSSSSSPSSSSSSSSSINPKQIRLDFDSMGANMNGMMIRTGKIFTVQSYKFIQATDNDFTGPLFVFPLKNARYLARVYVRGSDDEQWALKASHTFDCMASKTKSKRGTSFSWDAMRKASQDQALRESIGFGRELEYARFVGQAPFLRAVDYTMKSGKVVRIYLGRFPRLAAKNANKMERTPPCLEEAWNSQPDVQAESARDKQFAWSQFNLNNGILKMRRIRNVIDRIVGNDANSITFPEEKTYRTQAPLYGDEEFDNAPVLPLNSQECVQGTGGDFTVPIFNGPVTDVEEEQPSGDVAYEETGQPTASTSTPPPLPPRTLPSSSSSSPPPPISRIPNESEQALNGKSIKTSSSSSSASAKQLPGLMANSKNEKRRLDRLHGYEKEDKRATALFAGSQIVVGNPMGRDQFPPVAMIGCGHCGQPAVNTHKLDKKKKNGEKRTASCLSCKQTKRLKKRVESVPSSSSSSSSPPEFIECGICHKKYSSYFPMCLFCKKKKAKEEKAARKLEKEQRDRESSLSSPSSSSSTSTSTEPVQSSEELNEDLPIQAKMSKSSHSHSHSHSYSSKGGMSAGHLFKATGISPELHNTPNTSATKRIGVSIVDLMRQNTVAPKNFVLHCKEAARMMKAKNPLLKFDAALKEIEAIVDKYESYDALRAAKIFVVTVNTCDREMFLKKIKEQRLVPIGEQGDEHTLPKAAYNQDGLHIFREYPLDILEAPLYEVFLSHTSELDQALKTVVTGVLNNPPELYASAEEEERNVVALKEWKEEKKKEEEGIKPGTFFNKVNVPGFSLRSLIDEDYGDNEYQNSLLPPISSIPTPSTSSNNPIEKKEEEESSESESEQELQSDDEADNNYQKVPQSESSYSSSGSDFDQSLPSSEDDISSDDQDLQKSEPDSENEEYPSSAYLAKKSKNDRGLPPVPISRTPSPIFSVTPESSSSDEENGEEVEEEEEKVGCKKSTPKPSKPACRSLLMDMLDDLNENFQALPIQEEELGQEAKKKKKPAVDSKGNEYNPSHFMGNGGGTGSISPPHESKILSIASLIEEEPEEQESTSASTSAPAIGKCMWASHAHNNSLFNSLWTAVEQNPQVSQEYFDGPESIFKKDAMHVIVIPRQSIFKRAWKSMTRQGKKFRDFLRANTYALSPSYPKNTPYLVNSLDGEKRTQLILRDEHGTQYVQLEDGSVVPLVQLRDQIYAILSD